MNKAKNIDDYLAGVQEHHCYPTLVRMREIVHDVGEGLVEEKIKWGAPSFEYKGLLMGMLAFKKHVAAWFHKGALLTDSQKLLEASAETTKSMRKYIIHSQEEFNEEGFRQLVVEAMAKNDSGEEVKGMGQRSKAYEHSELLQGGLDSNPLAARNFASLSGYKQREFIEHIETAKQEATRQKRLQKSLDLLEKGIGLNDQYRK